MLLLVTEMGYTCFRFRSRPSTAVGEPSNSKFTTTTGQTVELGKPAREVSPLALVGPYNYKSAMQTLVAARLNLQ